MTTEVFYTAFYDAIWHAGVIDWKLKGNSYMWMFPIYGLIAFGFPFLMHHFQKIGLIGRAILYGIGIMGVEYVAGWLLRTLTGVCPWEYRVGVHIHGLVRLDYFPFWALFGAGIERVLVWLIPRLTEAKKSI